jgi:nucleoside-diphosphate-sugar epimerase
MKVAITGQNGFLGKHLVELLQKEKIDFTVFDKEKYNLLDPLTLQEFVEGKDVIVHIAGANRDSNFNLLNINVMGTAGIMEAISLFNPKAKMIFASSVQVYTENTIYSLSKKMAEEVIERYSRLYNIKSITFRISNMFGPGCKPYYNSVIATFIDQIRHEKPLSIIGDGSQEKDFIYVTDVAKAIVQAIKYEQKEIFEYFDICFGEQHSLNDIIHALEVITKKPIEVHYNKNQGVSHQHVMITNEKAKTELGWEPKVTVQDGLKEIIQAYAG